ncbi:ALP1-like protein [Tanacetum coccineum]
MELGFRGATAPVLDPSQFLDPEEDATDDDQNDATDLGDWSWENCPVAFRAQFSRGDYGPDPFILLEAIPSNDLWIWHAFFGVS